MNLQEAIEKFEDKTAGGYPVEILAVKDAVLICAINAGQFWFGTTLDVYGVCSVEAHCLVPKKKHLPKDVLCEVWSQGGEKELRYSAGEGKFYCNGADSLTYDHYNPWDNFKVTENPIRPWFGGECPIPEGCEYRIFIDGIWHTGSQACFYIPWELSTGKARITAYQILGEA